MARQARVTFRQEREVDDFIAGLPVKGKRNFYEDRWVPDTVERGKFYTLSGLSGKWEAYTIHEYRDKP